MIPLRSEYRNRSGIYAKTDLNFLQNDVALKSTIPVRTKSVIAKRCRIAIQIWMTRYYTNTICIVSLRNENYRFLVEVTVVPAVFLSVALILEKLAATGCIVSLRNENYRFLVEVTVVPAEFLSVALILEKLAAADFAFSARLNDEVTRVSQHFGVLTIDSADGY
ncbi:hypothetical protein F511_34081 [Dorcoceras hygrometricum]|uniref:Uncharacterized protein n=1 Tax=Dorcoceras hygrometricum TaxID=472368 RepID=A0A2Z7BET6_9LAMI|nr:hypothetical protein F511_34081 [Dorcoceras hygrometricum]